MSYRVSASHVSADWHLSAVTFADNTEDSTDTNYSASYDVRGDSVNGYYAKAPRFGCGRHCATPERAIRSLLESNGCTAINITESAA